MVYRSLKVMWSKKNGEPGIKNAKDAKGVTYSTYKKGGGLNGSLEGDNWNGLRKHEIIHNPLGQMSLEKRWQRAINR